MGAPQPLPPHRPSYGDPPRVMHPPDPRTVHGPSGATQSAGSAPPPPQQAGTLDYASRGAEMWEFWTAQWWRRRRNLMSAGLGLFGLGLGLALSYWVMPGLLMAAGGFLVGLALPIRGE